LSYLFIIVEEIACNLLIHLQLRGHYGWQDNKIWDP